MIEFWKKLIVQGLVLLSAGFLLAIIATALYDLGTYVYGTQSFWAGSIFVILIFGVPVVGCALYGLYELYLAAVGLFILIRDKRGAHK